MAKKTDNANLPAKLALRRYMLAKYHGDDPPRVLDCCQGSRKLWSILEREFSLGGYWGLDVKPRKGRLRVDSACVLAQSGWDQNVIDVDTYGSPWKHWAAIVENVTGPATVFLTIGQLTTGTVGSLSRDAIDAMGLGSLARQLPKAFHVKLAELSVACSLARAGDWLREAVEADHKGNARYLAVRLEPPAGRPPD